MIWWWWILPAAVALIGAVVLIRGLGALFSGRPLSGLFGTLAGTAVVAAMAAAALLGLNIQTYERLIYERPVATIQLTQMGPQFYEAVLVQPASGPDRSPVTGAYPLHGDEWRIEAQVLKWKPWANVLGLDTQYRLDRLSGRYSSVRDELEAERSAHDLSGADAADRKPWDLQVWDVARRYRAYVDAVDTLYGGAAYMPMADGARYEIWITQSGLIARPANEAASEASAGGWTNVE